MKICPKCGAQCEDTASFCTTCGYSFSGAAPGYAPPIDPYDHTARFDPKDISDNKVIAMLVYLMGPIGIIIALLASANSPYVGFHLRQALKFVVVEALLGIVAAALIWTVIAPLAAAIMSMILFVLKVICFFQICSGKAKEAPIIRELNFLK